MRKSYLGALDTGQARAATTGKLDAALIWNDERRAFEETHSVELDDNNTPPPSVRCAAYRQRLTQRHYAKWAATPPGALAFGTLAADWAICEVQAKRLEGK